MRPSLLPPLFLTYPSSSPLRRHSTCFVWRPAADGDGWLALPTTYLHGRTDERLSASCDGDLACAPAKTCHGSPMRAGGEAVGGEAAGGGDARRSRHRRAEQRLIFLLPTASHCCGGGRSFGGSRGCELMMTDWRCGLRRRLLARQAGRDGVHPSGCGGVGCVEDQGTWRSSRTGHGALPCSLGGGQRWRRAQIHCSRGWRTVDGVFWYT
jgi:hypothetical protein